MPENKEQLPSADELVARILAGKKQSVKVPVEPSLLPDYEAVEPGHTDGNGRGGFSADDLVRGLLTKSMSDSEEVVGEQPLRIEHPSGESVEKPAREFDRESEVTRRSTTRAERPTSPRRRSARALTKQVSSSRDNLDGGRESRRATTYAEARQTDKRTKAEDDPEQDLVRMYLRDIGKHPLLTKEDEVRLAQAIEAGNEARRVLDEGGDLSVAEKRELHQTARAGERAKTTFVNSNLRLVVSIAKKYRSSDLPLLDLIQEGNFGMMHAVEKFDWRKGFKFSTYATWWIRQSITRGIANTGRAIRLPVHAGDTLGRVRRAKDKLEASGETDGQEATPEQIAAYLDMTVEDVKEAFQYGRTGSPVSLNTPLREDGDAELGDIVGDVKSGDGFEKAEFKSDTDIFIEALRRTLDAREFQFITERFGIFDGVPKTLEEVGEIGNLTRERVRQIESRAFCKLRHPAAPPEIRAMMGYLS